MDKVLRQLYFGGIHPMEGSYPTDPEYGELRRKFDERHDLLLDMLSEHGQRLLAEIIDLRVQMNRHEDVIEFLNGFKLGARILLEILVDEQ